MGNSSQICYHCFRQRSQAAGPCEYCGFDLSKAPHPHGALRPGTILQGRYLVGTLKQADPRYFDYRGMDLVRRETVTIREYFNPNLMGRQSDGVSVGYYSETAQTFLQEREQFARWADQIARSDGRYCTFKENHTWYLVKSESSPAGAGTGLRQESRTPSDAGAGVSAGGRDKVQDLPGIPSEKHAKPTQPASVGRKRRGLVYAAAGGGGLLAVLLLILVIRFVVPGIKDPGGGNGGHGSSGTSSGSVTTVSEEENVLDSQQTNASSASTGKNYDPGTTVMIYLLGSNLESEGAEASKDLDEIMDCRIDTEKNNILVYTGGTRAWHNDIPADKNGTYLLLDDQSLRLAREESPVRNMGEADTLADFINYCTEKYPSEHYQLILWDHGGGPVYGFGVDENYAEDALEADEIRKAMDQTIFANKPLDLVAYNACIMGTVETAALWADYADYLLADGEVEYSWDYHYMEILNETSDPVKTARAIAEYYHEQYESAEAAAPDTPMALNCIDLTHFDQVLTCMDNLGEDLKEGMEQGDFGKIAAARTACFQYGYLNAASKANAYDLVDLGDLCNRLYSLYPETAKALYQEMEESIVFRQSSIPGRMGISIYFPYDCDFLYWLWTGLSGGLDSINPSEPWRSFTHSFAKEHFSGKSNAGWSLETGSGSKPELILTEEQAEDTAAVHAVILEDFGNGTYGTVLQNDPVSVSADGKAVLEEIPDIFCLVTSSDEIATAIPSVLMQSAGEIEYYCTESIDPDGIVRMLLNISGDALHAMFLRNRNTEQLEMLGFAADVAEDHSIVNTRNEVSLAGVDSISYTVRALIPQTDSTGNMLPCKEWEEASGGESRKLKIDYLSEDPDLPMPKKLTLAETGKSYVCQFIVEDVYGKEHGSELISIR